MAVVSYETIHMDSPCLIYALIYAHMLNSGKPQTFVSEVVGPIGKLAVMGIILTIIGYN